ncbi:MAG: hypothetical protein WAO14_09990, partial [Pseudolabrys sp.]
GERQRRTRINNVTNARSNWHSSSRRKNFKANQISQPPTRRILIAMSALHPKADICSATRYVRFVPKADIEQTCEMSADRFRRPNSLLFRI